MRRRIAVLSTGLAPFLWCAASFAQAPSRIVPYTLGMVPDDIHIKPEDRARATLIAYGACLLQYNSRGVTKLLAEMPGSDAYNSAAQKLSSDDCLYSGTLKFGTALLRGALYLALTRKSFLYTKPVLNAAMVNAADADANVQADMKNTYKIMIGFADCVVRKDPDASRGLILAAPGSAIEDQMVAQLSPGFGPCMPQGTKVTLNKSTLSSYVAEALYRDTLPSPASSPEAHH